MGSVLYLDDLEQVASHMAIHRTLLQLKYSLGSMKKRIGLSKMKGKRQVEEASMSG